MQVLDLSKLKYAPAALATARDITTTSDRYNFISTHSVLEALVADNWDILGAKQSRSRSRDPLFARHEITLGDPDLKLKEVGDSIPVFYLSNAHDGTATYRMQAGVEKLLCKNGLRAPEGLVQAVSIAHRGSRTIEEIVQAAQAYRSNVDLIGHNIRRFKEVQMSPAAAVEFAKQAIAIRHQDEPDGTVTITDVLQSQRPEDAATDLWTVFNRVQEWILRGGYPVHRLIKNDTEWSTRKARPIKAILEGARVNTKLWEVAELFSKN